MRKCCCCISVHAGAITLGLLGVLLTISEIVPLVTYFADWDPFNPIGKNLEDFYYLMEKTMQEHRIDKETVTEIMKLIRDNLHHIFTVELISGGIYFLVSLLLIFGVSCKVRSLMLPYLVINMLLIVWSLLIFLGITVILFFANIIMGIVSLSVVLVFGFIIVYLWVAVQNSYIELGNRDYMYSPAPVKPYNDRNESYYPKAPQQFQLDQA